VKEVIIALVSSSIAIVITSFFNYHFQLMKEIRNEAVKYKTEILKNVYTPLLKIRVAAVVPGDGYDGITKEVFSEIEEIIKRNYELVDPDLDSIFWSTKKGIRRVYYEYSKKLFDENKQLLRHIELDFNFYSKQLGLPFNKTKLKKYLFLND
jgi:hypothetical protein